MKTLWLFVICQISAWTVGMTLALRFLEEEYPRACYILASGSTFAGLLLWLWVSPKIEDMTPLMRVIGLVIFAGGLIYIASVIPLLQQKWTIPPI